MTRIPHNISADIIRMLIGMAFLFMVMPYRAIANEEDTLKLKVIRQLDNPEVAAGLVEAGDVADMLDSLDNIKYFKDYYFTTDTQELNIYGFEKDEVPQYNDSVYTARIATLNEETPVEMAYNRTVRT